MINDDFPSYTRRLQDISSLYIKDGKILKNRKRISIIDVAYEKSNYNNIVIEKNGIVNIYCQKEYVENYKNAIEFLKKFANSYFIDNTIIINSI